MAATWIYACFCCQEMMWFTILRWWSTWSGCAAISSRACRLAEALNRSLQTPVHCEVAWCANLAAALVRGGEQCGSGSRGLRRFPRASRR